MRIAEARGAEVSDCRPPILGYGRTGTAFSTPVHAWRVTPGEWDWSAGLIGTIITTDRGPAVRFQLGDDSMG